ncbi:DUF2953 domain-containing protein [Alicyclobacillus kakegawensis]|uniref:DUF2953 domain-containing protein n=1 Tax=Alicyclobacillus kakegawensis TaxID=392012 RepID=UPI0008322E34|nr:DUF2953 domain-containing protein [Alicyclobacillus kakegawensis]
MWFLFLTAVVFVVLAFVLALPVTLYISLEPSHNSWFSVDVRLRGVLGLVRIHKKIHDIEVLLGPGGPSVAAQHETFGWSGREPGHRMDLTTHEVLDLIRHWPQWLARLQEIKGILKEVLSKIWITEFVVTVRYGVKDAAVTGLLHGLIWSGLGLVMVMLVRTFSFQAEPAIVVQPEFHSPGFTLKGSCIMKLRFGYAILAMMGLLRVWRRRGHHGTPNSRAHADGHEQHTRNG